MTEKNNPILLAEKLWEEYISINSEQTDNSEQTEAKKTILKKLEKVLITSLFEKKYLAKRYFILGQLYHTSLFSDPLKSILYLEKAIIKDSSALYAYSLLLDVYIEQQKIKSIFNLIPPMKHEAKKNKDFYKKLAETLLRIAFQVYPIQLVKIIKELKEIANKTKNPIYIYYLGTIYEELDDHKDTYCYYTKYLNALKNREFELFRLGVLEIIDTNKEDWQKLLNDPTKNISEIKNQLKNQVEKYILNLTNIREEKQRIYKKIIEHLVYLGNWQGIKAIYNQAKPFFQNNKNNYKFEGIVFTYICLIYPTLSFEKHLEYFKCFYPYPAIHENNTLTKYLEYIKKKHLETKEFARRKVIEHLLYKQKGGKSNTQSQDTTKVPFIDALTPIKLNAQETVINKETQEKEIRNFILTGFLLEHPRAKFIAIICHGFTSSLEGIKNLAYHIHRYGAHIIMINFRGHGDSGGTKSTIGFEEANDVENTFLYAREKYPKLPIVIFGHSMGGAATIIQSTHNHKKQLSIVLSSYFDLSREIKNWINSPAFQEELNRFLIVKKQAKKFFTEYIETIVKLVLKEIGISKQEANLLNAARKINIPIKIFHGKNDNVTPHTESLIFYKNLKRCPHKEIWLYPGGDHRDVIENITPEEERQILNFIEKFYPTAMESFWKKLIRPFFKIFYVIKKNFLAHRN